MQKIKIIKKPTEELIPYDNNPRNNDRAVNTVANSIMDFGFRVPIITDKNDTIIAGHTRLKAAKKLRLQEVPCIVADDLTEEQTKALRLVDNKLAELSDWDEEKLYKEFEDLRGLLEPYGFDTSDTGDAILERRLDNYIDYPIVMHPENYNTVIDILLSVQMKIPRAEEWVVQLMKGVLENED